MKIDPERYVFWLDDITVLYKNNNYINFVPGSNMSRVEQLNAITRFFMYLIIILFLFDTTAEYMYLPIVGIIMIIVLYNIFKSDNDGKKEELIRMKNNNSEKLNKLEDFENKSDINYRTYQIDDDGDIITFDIDSISDSNKSNVSSINKNNQDSKLETNIGFYDSNNVLQYNNDKNNDKAENKLKYSLDDIRLYEDSKCRRPTYDNPYMNSTINDFNTDNSPIACNSDDEDIKKDIEIKFNEDMYRDIDDVYDKFNSQRQFFTVANNIPNDMEAFARWCYKFPPTCKTNQERCLRYEDLRTKY